MPLNTTNQTPKRDDARKAIGVWMTVEGDPIRAVRVFVTYETLARLDSAQLRDVHAAFEIFDKNRRRIEAAASQKFDACGVEVEERYEEQRVLNVCWSDLE
jgi:hypothetical protein